MLYTINAKGKKLGRLASEVATILQGKKNPNYEPRLEGNDTVVITNIGKILVTGRKADQKVYYHHAGQLGHLKKKTYREAFEKSPEWVLRHAVRLMLPKNRLQSKRLQRLIIE